MLIPLVQVTFWALEQWQHPSAYLSMPVCPSLLRAKACLLQQPGTGRAQAPRRPARLGRLPGPLGVARALSPASGRSGGPGRRASRSLSTRPLLPPRKEADPEGSEAESVDKNSGGRLIACEMGDIYSPREAFELGDFWACGSAWERFKDVLTARASKCGPPQKSGHQVERTVQALHKCKLLQLPASLGPAGTQPARSRAGPAEAPWPWEPPNPPRGPPYTGIAYTTGNFRGVCLY